jgi:hypothetical protein
MKTRFLPAVVVALSGLIAWAAVQAQQSEDPKKAAANMAAMMEKAKRFTQPGDRHKALERFLGKWTMETRFFMAGKPTEPEKGTAEFSWLMAGRWMKSEWKGSMMRTPMEGFMILGYDNFKQSYVSTMISSLDTAMTHAEGDMDPSGNALLSYGTLDEYLTGEHDKMVKYVWRFPSKDKMVLEVHDLPIGEQNTKVLEISYARAP